jgi:hypothetical protein
MRKVSVLFQYLLERSWWRREGMEKCRLPEWRRGGVLDGSNHIITKHDLQFASQFALRL